jgi:hypothetical protein
MHEGKILRFEHVLQQNERLGYCKKCRRWFIDTGIRCAVSHPAGECCHYGLKEVEPNEVLDGLNVMQENL